MPPAIDIRDVTVFRWSQTLRRRTYLLKDFNWRVESGEHWAVLGPNGAGKTTLMHMAAAITQPTSGEVSVLGGRFGRTDLRGLRERIGFVDSRVAKSLWPKLTGLEVVITGGLGTIFLDEPRVTDEIRQRAQEFLALVGMERVTEREFGQCSQGERQRLLVARALMGSPELLLLDEPGAGMDLPSREGLIKAMVSLAADRPEMPTVIVTHHLEEIPPTCSHVLLLAEGAPVAQGPVAEVLTDELVSRCFGLPIQISGGNGRWAATAV